MCLLHIIMGLSWHLHTCSQCVLIIFTLFTLSCPLIPANPLPLSLSSTSSVPVLYPVSFNGVVYRMMGILPVATPLSKMSLPPLSTITCIKQKEGTPPHFVTDCWLAHLLYKWYVGNCSCWVQQSPHARMPAFHVSLHPPSSYIVSASSSSMFCKPWNEWYHSPIFGWIFNHYLFIFSRV